MGSEEEKWVIGIMVPVTIVKFVLMVYCRRFKPNSEEIPLIQFRGKFCPLAIGKILPTIFFLQILTIQCPPKVHIEPRVPLLTK